METPSELVPSRTYGFKISATALEYLHHQARLASVQSNQNLQVCDLVKAALVKVYGRELEDLLSQK
jgi:hypothetical protein